ncbi:hypothetical protein V0M98_33575 (plasmid) [Pseudomonas silesiensis]|uniref:hypothetical protein n=1 Tax=Pseudomonas silesiensis TaxID=1853130 RepID=UPI0030D5FBD5
MNEHFHTLDHSPIRPASEGCIGEEVFLRRWRKLLAFGNGYHPFSDGINATLEYIVKPCDPGITQRHATVAASLIRWLGSNDGLAFLEKADLKCGSLGNREEAYIAEWALENSREGNSSFGLLTIEQVMMRVGDVEPPTLSVDDCETMAHLLMWLAAEHCVYMQSGPEFLKACRDEIQSNLPAEANRRPPATSLKLVVINRAPDAGPVRAASEDATSLITRPMTIVSNDMLPKELEARLPGITWAQRHSLCTYLEKGWQAVDVGRAGEVNITRGDGLAAEHGYLRVDGIYRPA